MMQALKACKEHLTFDERALRNRDGGPVSPRVALLFGEGGVWSPLLIEAGIIECPARDCGAPCNPGDVFDDGTCRYCGENMFDLLEVNARSAIRVGPRDNITRDVNYDPIVDAIKAIREAELTGGTK